MELGYPLLRAVTPTRLRPAFLYGGVTQKRTVGEQPLRSSVSELLLSSRSVLCGDGYQPPRSYGEPPFAKKSEAGAPRVMSCGTLINFAAKPPFSE